MLEPVSETKVYRDTLDHKYIQRLIPHRFPMLLVDRVEQLVPGESAVGIKNVTMNEWFFQGHFPDHPVMPGVLVVEAMAQTAAVFVLYGMDAEDQGKVVYFLAIDECKFRKPVLPGDQVRMELTKVRNKGNVWKVQGIAKVNGEVTTEALMTAMIVDEKGA